MYLDLDWVPPDREQRRSSRRGRTRRHRAREQAPRLHLGSACGGPAWMGAVAPLAPRHGLRDVTDGLGRQRATGREMVGVSRRSRIVGSKKARKPETVVHRSKEGRAGEDIVARVVRIRAEAMPVAHLAPGRGHQLHQAHSARRAYDGPATELRPAAALDEDHCFDPGIGKLEPRRGLRDRRGPGVERMGGCRKFKDEHGCGAGELQPAGHRSFASPRIPSLAVVPK